MATIREYTTQTNVPNAPNIQGLDLGGVFGNVAGQIGDWAARVKDTQQRQEVSDVQVKLAQARADWTVEMEKRATEAPAGDPTFAAKFGTDFNTYLEKQGHDYATQAGRLAWQTGSAELGAHFTETAGVYQINSAGVKARQDYNSMLDLTRNVLQHDPGQFQSVLKSTLDALNDPNGMYAKMPADVKEKLQNATKNELGFSAFQGLASQHPQEALRQLSAGVWDDRLDADKMMQANNLAERMLRAQEVDIVRAQAAADKAAKVQDRAAQDEYFGMMAKDEPNPVVKAIELDARLSPESKRAMTSAVEASIRPEPAATVSNPNETEFFRRMHLPQDDPNNGIDENFLNDARGRGQLTQPALERLRKELADNRTEEGAKLGKKESDFLQGFKGQITKSVLDFVDDPGDQHFLDFKFDLDRKIEEYRKAGKNPHDLFDRSKPDYFGSDANILNYHKPLQQQLQDDLAKQRSSVETPTAPTTHAAIVTRASKTAINGAGVIIYLVDGTWIDGEGNAVK